LAASHEDFARIAEEAERLIGAVRLEIAELECVLSPDPPPESWAIESLSETEAPVAPPAPRAEPEPRPAPAQTMPPAAAPTVWTKSPWVARSGVLASVAALIWLGMSFFSDTVVLPTASLVLPTASVRAVSAWTDGGIAAVEEAGVVFYDRGGLRKGFLPLADLPSAIAWDSGVLYAVDGRSKRLQHWGDIEADPTIYGLDHVPQAVFVRAPYCWTVDANGPYLRQYLMSSTMIGLLFQQLDLLKMPDIKTRDLFVAKDAGAVMIEAETGRILTFAAQKNSLLLKTADDTLPTYARASAHLVASDGPLRLATRSENGEAVNVRPYQGPLDLRTR
jgi:hypothetical protein